MDVLVLGEVEAVVVVAVVDGLVVVEEVVVVIFVDVEFDDVAT